MKVIDSSGIHSFGELDFPQCGNSVKQMFGEESSGQKNTAEGKCSLLTDKIREYEIEIQVSKVMVKELEIEMQNLNADSHRAKAQQRLLQTEASAVDEESEEEESEEAGSERREKREERNRAIQGIVTYITKIKSDIGDNDALTQQHSTLFAAQEKELRKLQREKSVRRRTTRASMSSPSTGGTTPIKVNRKAVGKAHILHDAINELTHYFLPKANSSMDRSWKTWCVDNGF